MGIISIVYVVGVTIVCVVGAYVAIKSIISSRNENRAKQRMKEFEIGDTVFCMYHSKVEKGTIIKKEIVQEAIQNNEGEIIDCDDKTLYGIIVQDHGNMVKMAPLSADRFFLTKAELLESL